MVTKCNYLVAGCSPNGCHDLPWLPRTTPSPWCYAVDVTKYSLGLRAFSWFPPGAVLQAQPYAHVQANNSFWAPSPCQVWEEPKQRGYLSHKCCRSLLYELYFIISGQFLILLWWMPLIISRYSDGARGKFSPTSSDGKTMRWWDPWEIVAVKLIPVTSAQAGIIVDGSAKICSLFTLIDSPIVHHQESLIGHKLKQASLGS